MFTHKISAQLVEKCTFWVTEKHSTAIDIKLGIFSLHTVLYDPDIGKI